MPRVEVAPYESAIVTVNGYDVVLEAHKDDFSVGLQPDMTLAETWATLAPSLSRGDPSRKVICENRIPGEEQVFSQGDAIENIWKFSANQRLVDRLRLSFLEHVFSWERKEGSPHLDVTFRRFEPELIRKVLSVGKLTILRAEPDIMARAEPLFKRFA